MKSKFANDTNGSSMNNQLNTESAIHKMILSFLEGLDPVGPSLDVFKLAMLNKKMLRIIVKIYGIRDFTVFAEN